MSFVLISYVDSCVFFSSVYKNTIYFIFLAVCNKKTAKVNDGTLMTSATNNVACSQFSFEAPVDCCFNDTGGVQFNGDVRVLAEYDISWVGVVLDQ